ncbi:hypothetical protein NDU88_002992 [Pleurodeles waltl]|uniref:Uncharacterized protein n=1 Tax=Pleurodeles waltl TaxID=8319 RepID=A0AAV7VEV8_PLEWA|nr:hypothetical protein NDU88_002992 [Pleurodeles waltl]
MRPPAAHRGLPVSDLWGTPHHKGATALRAPTSHLQAGLAAPPGPSPLGRKGLTPAVRTSRPPCAARQPCGHRSRPRSGLQRPGGLQPDKTAEGPPSSTSSHLALAWAKGNPSKASTAARSDPPGQLRRPPAGQTSAGPSATPPAHGTASRQIHGPGKAQSSREILRPGGALPTPLCQGK